jgi:hypothetical protein
VTEPTGLVVAADGQIARQAVEQALPGMPDAAEGGWSGLVSFYPNRSTRKST